MHTEQQPVDHRQFETRWLKPFTDAIPGWEQLHFVQRFLAREGKQFILWRLDNDLQPEVLSKYKVTGFMANLAGPEMVLQGDFDEVVISAAPTQLAGHDIYVWIPAMFDSRFAPLSYLHGNPLQRCMTWRFCAKSVSNPAIKSRNVSGQVYFSEAGEFRKLWVNTPI